MNPITEDQEWTLRRWASTVGKRPRKRDKAFLQAEKGLSEEQIDSWWKNIDPPKVTEERIEPPAGLLGVPSVYQNSIQNVGNMMGEPMILDQDGGRRASSNYLPSYYFGPVDKDFITSIDMQELDTSMGIREMVETWSSPPPQACQSAQEQNYMEQGQLMGPSMLDLHTQLWTPSIRSETRQSQNNDGYYSAGMTGFDAQEQIPTPPQLVQSRGHRRSRTDSTTQSDGSSLRTWSTANTMVSHCDLYAEPTLAQLRELERKLDEEEAAINSQNLALPVSTDFIQHSAPPQQTNFQLSQVQVPQLQSPLHAHPTQPLPLPPAPSTNYYQTPLPPLPRNVSKSMPPPTKHKFSSSTTTPQTQPQPQIHSRSKSSPARPKAHSANPSISHTHHHHQNYQEQSHHHHPPKTQEPTTPSSNTGKYSCTICTRPFTRKGDWKRHEEKHDPQTLWICLLGEPAILTSSPSSTSVSEWKCVFCGLIIPASPTSTRSISTSSFSPSSSPKDWFGDSSRPINKLQKKPSIIGRKPSIIGRKTSGIDLKGSKGGNGNGNAAHGREEMIAHLLKVHKIQTCMGKKEEGRCFGRKDKLKQHMVQVHGFVEEGGMGNGSVNGNGGKEGWESWWKSGRRKWGWGCGFCGGCLFTWEGRLLHIAEHFERDNLPISRWTTSLIIKGLLKQCHSDFNISVAWKNCLGKVPNADQYLEWSPSNADILKRKLEFHEGRPEEVAAEAKSLAFSRARSSADMLAAWTSQGSTQQEVEVEQWPGPFSGPPSPWKPPTQPQSSKRKPSYDTKMTFF